jgi:succinoglycan biosynthesis protein ExoM
LIRQFFVTTKRGRGRIGQSADWIAFTDDDCWVSPTWLANLIRAAGRYKADVVYGRREFLLPLPSPFWAVRPEPAKFTEGQKLRNASTHNVLFARWLIRQHQHADMRFDERLAHGEDTDFFHRATLRGAHIAYSHEPVVFETVSPERATLRYQVKRAYHYAASRSYFHRRYKGSATAIWKFLDHLIVKAPFAIVRLICAPLVWPFSERAFKHQVVRSAARLTGAAGAAAGLLGFDGNPYWEIDGY